MSYEDNWESFLNDETETKSADTDNWDAVTDEDFEDVLSIEPPKAPEKEIKVEYDDFSDTTTFDRPVRKVERRKEWEEDEEEDKWAPKKKPKKTGNLVLILIIIFAAVVVIAGIFFAIKLLGGSGEDSTQEYTEATTAYWQQEDAGDVSTLVNSYYTARTLQDTYTLSQILDPSVTIDEAVLANEANVVEGYQNISCYTTDGIKSGEWAVYVSYVIKFKNIATPAPGLVATYVKTDESGIMRLIPWEDVQKNEEIYNFIGTVSDCDAITKLANDVYAAYEQALASDADLKGYIDLLKGGSDEPSTDPSTDVTDPTTEAPTTEAPTTQAPIQPADDSDFTACDTCMYITKDGVNMRKKPSTDADIIKGLAKGTYMHVMAKSTDWYKVSDFQGDGSVGYVSSQFFSDSKPQ